MAKTQIANPLEHIVTEKTPYTVLPLDTERMRALAVLQGMQTPEKMAPAEALDEITVTLATLSQEQRDELARIVYDDRKHGGNFLAALFFKRLSRDNEIPDSFTANPASPVAQGLNILAWAEQERVTEWINALVAPHTIAAVQKLSHEHREALARNHYFQSETRHVTFYLNRKRVERQEPTAVEKACLAKLTHRLRKLPQHKREEVAEFVQSEREMGVGALVTRLYGDLTEGTWLVDEYGLKEPENFSSPNFTMRDPWDPLTYDETAPYYMETETDDKAKKFYNETVEACRLLWRLPEEKMTEWVREIVAPHTLRERGALHREKKVFNAVQYVKTIIPHKLRLLTDSKYRAYYKACTQIENGRQNDGN